MMTEAPRIGSTSTSLALRLVRNLGWLAVGAILNGIIGLVITLYLASVLGTSNFGTIGIALAIHSFLTLIVGAGTEPGGIREVAREADGTPLIYARVAGYRLMLAVLVMLCAIVYLPMRASLLSVPTSVVLVFALSVFPAALTTVWALRGLDRMDLVAAANVVQRVLVLLGLVLLVRPVDTKLLLVPVVHVAAASAVALWCYWRVTSWYGFLPVRFDRKRWGVMTRESVPVTLNLLFRFAFSQGPILLLGWLANTASAGAFLVSHKLVLTLVLISGVVQQATFPETSRLALRSPDRALRLQTVVLRHTLTLMTPVIVIVALVPDQIIGFFFGDAYESASRVLSLTAFSLPVLAFAGTSRQLLLAGARPRHLALTAGFGAVIHVLLGVLLIPTWGVVGAAIACLIGELAAAVALAAVVRRALSAIPWDWRFFAPVVAGAAMALAWLVGPTGNPAIRLLLSGFVYALVALVLGAVRRDELRRAIAYVRETPAPARGGAPHERAGPDPS